jgi:hypothetical protein
VKAEWYTLYQDEVANCRLEFFRKRVFLHLSFNKPFEGMRKAKKIWPELKLMLRNMGYKQMNVIIPDGDEKLYKFERHFGFVEKRRGKGLILMEQET